GPLMNLIFAIFVFGVVGMLGEKVPGTQLGDIDTGSAAYSAGFRSGDQILKIGSTSVNQWSEVKEIIERSAGKTLSFVVQHDGSEQVEEISAMPEIGKNPFLFSTERQVGQIEGLSTDSASSLIAVPNEKSPAALSGLKTFDLIESINGTEVNYWRQLEPLLAAGIVAGEIKIVARGFSDKGESLPERTIQLPITGLNNDSPLLNQIGITRTDLFLLSIREKSPAALAGLKAGDQVVDVDGKKVLQWQTILDKVKSFKLADKSIAFTVSRNGEEKTVSIIPEQIDLPTEQGAMESRYAIGVVPAILSSPNAPYLFKISNPLSAAVYGVQQSWVWTKLIAISLVRLVQNEVSARNIGGVITIGRVASKSFEVGVGAFLKMMAIISINLFLLNLLPVPVLDGGHLVFFTIEALKGAPISFKKLEIAQQVGLVLLLSLMLFALFNDISHLISSW
ncbi:MAG: RIP metalloprotease RseP, partial [Bdellovibrionales bacterium]|nr:RIP metalloprotease RseP [Bdellovibrionales bacterium]